MEIRGGGHEQLISNFQPIRVSEEPVFIYLFLAKSSFYLTAFEISRFIPYRLSTF
jgi:hypothetical protein